MARFDHTTADSVSTSSNGASFFSLKNDKDTAQVRFLYDTIDDIEGFVVHEIELNGKKRYVNCLRESGDSVDVCPFCKAGKKPFAKLFLCLYDLRDNSVKTWERGAKYFSKVVGVCTRFAQNSPIRDAVFEIERNGVAGDQKTTYEIYPCAVEADPNVPEAPVILGGLVLDKTADEMQTFLNTGNFNATAPVQRQAEPMYTRRVPTRNVDPTAPF